MVQTHQHVFQQPIDQSIVVPSSVTTTEVRRSNTDRNLPVLLKDFVSMTINKPIAYPILTTLAMII